MPPGCQWLSANVATIPQNTKKIGKLSSKGFFLAIYDYLCDMKPETSISQCREAAAVIKEAILKSQARAASAINREQLALYYGIGRYVSENTRHGAWGTSAIKNISAFLKADMPGLRGFSETNLKMMRTFFEEWKELERNSSVRTDETTRDKVEKKIRQLELTNYTNFPIEAFLGLSFTHHINILQTVKTLDERLFYIRHAYELRLKVDDLKKHIQADLFHHQGHAASNFLRTIPDNRLAMRTLQMFKDEYLLDFINVEEIDVSDPEDIDEKVIENRIVMNIKNFIMTFGRAFTYKGHQVHYDKLGHDHWVDLLFFNRELKSLVCIELKKGTFKTAYLGQLAAYLRILDDDERLAGENPSVGIILCKDADKAYVEYVLQDYLKPMGVATYKANQDQLRQLLPPEDDIKKLLE